ncbi:hypothetical protein [Mycolicibacterium holsaticum]|uniref:hypothetical protein n=1 Tax=Mycolicibacterium holsaticum TaxID=152142 RepID=UPI001C7D29F0|nr:hypothetical protein [Mycolicibacterium holsaticum]QZA14422.1 hypothetical protein K3U96_10120 [Mycolicibacterium holsaticum DSM 44478 = JCM 12374]UNC08128.1 hypothetical protein H5U41_16710 [Mycolicibacterium holsaticum DSM 44478 = JCM 12374]
MAKMKPGNGALAVAVVLFVLTALFALWNVNNRDGIVCGSWLSPNDQHAKLADYEDFADPRYFSNDRQVTDCAEARADRTPVVVVFGVLTIAALAVGVLRRYQPRDASTGNNPANLKPIPRMRRDDD